MRYGQDQKIEDNTFFNVHAEMLFQIMRDYSGLPDYRTLKAHEIRFFYDGLRPELYKHTGAN